ncbi:MAG TPA: hypothetical protein VNN25_07130 [Thermoanaerobaculia bacterium]|nr:hypothetical protein [Thermoanaerobaculia bacterium]
MFDMNRRSFLFAVVAVPLAPIASARPLFRPFGRPTFRDTVPAMLLPGEKVLAPGEQVMTVEHARDLFSKDKE